MRPVSDFPELKNAFASLQSFHTVGWVIGQVENAACKHLFPYFRMFPFRDLVKPVVLQILKQKLDLEYNQES